MRKTVRFTLDQLGRVPSKTSADTTVNSKATYVSRLSLRISDKSMQSEFINYLRGETKKNAVYVLIGLSLLTVILLGSKMKGTGEKGNDE